MNYSVLKYEIENAALLHDYILSSWELSKILNYCLVKKEDPYTTVGMYICDLRECKDISWLEKI